MGDINYLFKKFLGILSVCLLSSGSFALQLIQGKVLLVEPTNLPNLVDFQMDVGNAACPAGTTLYWEKANQENNKAVYSALLTALMTGKTIRFYINDNDTTCRGQYFHILSN